MCDRQQRKQPRPSRFSRGQASDAGKDGEYGRQARRYASEPSEAAARIGFGVLLGLLVGEMLVAKVLVTCSTTVIVLGFLAAVMQLYAKRYEYENRFQSAPRP